ncbi:ATP-dependent sacrificial sulfur transferase LarE [Treponema endosymbiont of Eucomonympha sp.]|uniref:ATP-dependent sacrificial sulfur transferase LarE n=1 Tax=Treponema endosymbiont of Eucomonympha sp. TaxID=1580831 RepID=UPI00078125C8|nr:ATP-dependent sacrificial sulfur transferase LarE [Treponema endosymbiont of Eucomonympha sp.]
MTVHNGKYEQLLAVIAAQRTVAVAFSGGVDSSFLCYAAHEALGDKALAVTVVSPMLPKSEIACAKRVAAQIGITHALLDEPEIDAEVAANPADRCYHCKKREFGAIAEYAERRGLAAVLDGSNQDDLSDYRPGLQALKELRILSPLREARLTKAEIRDMSHEAGLPTWDKPAFACLASRVPYGEPISREKLAKIEQAEESLRAFGFRQFRVRAHGDIARIEVAPDERPLFFDAQTLDAISAAVKRCGFLYAAFELEGYTAGSLNKPIRKN